MSNSAEHDPDLLNRLGDHAEASSPQAEPPASSSPPSAPTPAPAGTQRIAPAWHTVVLTLVMTGLAFASANSQHQFADRHGRVILYTVTIVWEWLIVAFIAWGIRKMCRADAPAGSAARLCLRDLVAGRWNSFEAVLNDIATAFAFWIAAAIVLNLTALAMGMMHANALAETREKLQFLVPRGGLEFLLFLALSATAGFCEEVIFRGYFQRQFAALTGSVSGGLILQAILFGAGHAYEGRQRMVLITVYGAMFGLLAVNRHSLRPGMLAHFLHDASAGIALRRLLR